VNNSKLNKGAINEFREKLAETLDVLVVIENEFKVTTQLKEIIAEVDLVDAINLHKTVLECRTAQFLSEIEIAYIEKRLRKMKKELRQMVLGTK
jgi:hypothetical protein